MNYICPWWLTSDVGRRVSIYLVGLGWGSAGRGDWSSVGLYSVVEAGRKRKHGIMYVETQRR